MHESDYVTIKELAARTHTSSATLYARSRFNEIPGQVRLGRRVLVCWATFRAALEAGDLSHQWGRDAGTAQA
ncbi:MAG: hypothetical protein O2954_19280 [bacterium]|nr:hypothetical protein [bacterium]